MTGTTELHFGPFEVHAQRREVLRDGRIQDIAPKAFELLLLLLEERHRVVTKHEIVTALWRQSVSESVIARTLMNVRQVIGDSATHPVWIKTIRGCGYRFVGHVVEAPVLGQAALAAQPLRANEQLRIAVLPCENQTADPSLDWTQFGLMALVGHALEADERLDVVSMHALLEVFGRLPADALVQERAQIALKALGLALVVQSSLRRQGTTLWLDYQLLSADGVRCKGSLREGHAVAIGQRFALAISADALPGEGAKVAFESRDSYVNQAFARAIELWRQQQLHSALTLFEMVCDREPTSLPAHLWRLRVLTLLCRPEAASTGSSLLELAEARGERRMQVITHLAMGQAKYVASGDPDSSIGHFRKAEQLLEGLPSSDLTGMVHMHLGIDAHSRQQLPQALREYGRAEAAFIAAGYPFHLGHVYLHQAMLEELAGNLLTARERFERALVLLRQHRLPAYEAVVLAGLAELKVSLGNLTRGLVDAVAATDMLEVMQSPQAGAMLVAAVSLVYAECGATHHIDRAITLFRRRFPGDLGPRIEGPLLQAATHQALCRGDLASLRAAAEQARNSDWKNANALLMVNLHQLRAETAVGCHDLAAEIADRLAASPSALTYFETAGALARARAGGCLARGEVEEAQSWLGQSYHGASLGREQARARIDAAWLRTEDGHTQRAASLLAGAGAWRSEHPAGLAADARLHFATGQYDAAIGLQLKALRSHQGTVPIVHLTLLQAYRDAAGGVSTPLPRMIGLAADSWLPDLR